MRGNVKKPWAVRKAAACLMAAMLLCSGGAALAAGEFSDIDPGAWYAADMEYAVEAGLLSGFGDRLMRPESPASRAQLWAVLARAAGETNGGDSWAQSAAQWAILAGISGGADPEAAATREEAITALWILDGSFMSDGAMPFSDAGDISPASLQAVIWAAEQGIVSGFPGGELRPTAPLTRAQLAAMVHRYLER